MKPRSPQSMQLYKMLISRGYPEDFCDLVTKNLNTDFTASRMIGYLCLFRSAAGGDRGRNAGDLK